MTATGGDGSARPAGPARTAVAIGVVVVLLAGVVALLAFRGDDRGSAPGSGGGEAGAAGGDAGGVGPDGFDTTPRHAIDGSARSVVFEGRILGVGSVRVDGAERTTLEGQVVDSAGTALGAGTVEAAGAAHLTGSEMTVATSGVRLRPGQPALAAAVGGGRRGLQVSSSGPLSLAAGRITFMPREGNRSPQELAGPVTVSPDGGAGLDAEIDGEQVRWTDAPASMRIAHPGSGRATLSWAGSGRIDAGDRAVEAAFLGLKAQRLEGTITAEGGTLRITGQASLRQVYADGLPQLPTTGAVAVKEVRGAAPGERAWFRWAPENRGQHDMAITAIRPGDERGGWVNLALDQLPEMCGGEPCPRRGGDTTGLGKRGSGGFLGIGSRSAQPIDAVVLPGTGDESEVSVDIPPGTPPGEHVVTLVLEGNFEPVRVEVRIPVR